MKVFRHILGVVALLMLLVSCSGRPRIIPRSTLTDIYADMFLADQWLVDHNSERRKVDTMLFYDPIFRSYGYTFQDYDASVQHYLKDPEKFSRIFRDAAEKLRKSGDVYARKVRQQELIREFNASIKGYQSRDFEMDTLLWRTAFKDSLLRLRDSLLCDSLHRDSLLRDSLLRDSLVRDSLVRDSLRLDSLRRVSKPVHKKLAKEFNERVIK